MMKRPSCRVIITDIDIINCTTSGEMAGQAGHDERSGDSRQGRCEGGGATEAEAEEGGSLPEQCAARGKESLMTLSAALPMSSNSLRRVAMDSCLL